MISKSILDKAKSFLCWDIFSELSVQLIEIQESISYFFPPSKHPTIIVFYRKNETDFTIPLFHLFHEAGHLLQFKEMKHRDESKTFWENVNTPAGTEKIKFEKQGWQKGYTLLEKFIQKKNLDPEVLEKYDNHAEKSIETYK